MKPDYLDRYPTMVGYRFDEHPEALFSTWNIPKWMRMVEAALPSEFQAWWEEVDREPVLFALEDRSPVTLSSLVHPETHEWTAPPGLVVHWLLSEQGQRAKETLLDLTTHDALWTEGPPMTLKVTRGKKFGLDLDSPRDTH